MVEASDALGYKKFAGLLLVLAAMPIAMVHVASASYITMTEPYNYTVLNGSTVYIGKDGPGQTFFITISAATTNSTGAVNGYGWNKLVVSNLPAGWIAQNSSLYTPTLSVKITPSPNAANGTYRFDLAAINIGNYSKLGSERFTAVINITPDVFRLDVAPTTVYESTGTPAEVSVSINNTGVSDALFLVNITGLPASNQTATEYALHHTVQQFTYPISVAQPGVYHVNLNVRSESSPLVYKYTNITLISRATILNDYSAIGSGVVAFPIVYEPLYAAMYLISRIFSH